MWPQVAAILLPSLLFLGEVDPSGQGDVTVQQIDRAVESLGAESFSAREAASDFVWRAGKAAEPALRKALLSDDAEVVLRAGRILRQFQYGIYAGTPGEVVTLIGRYRYGTQAARLAVLKTLLDKGEPTTLLTLLKTEPDEKFRKQLTDGLLKDLDKLAGALFIKGDWPQAEQLLEIGAASDAGMRNYAAYLLLRGQLEAKISQLHRGGAAGEEAAACEDRPAGPDNAVDARLLVYLRRANGDLSGALAAAESLSDPLMTASILFELGDWKQLAQLHAKSPEQTSATLPGGIVDLGYAAAYHRLAGNAEELREAVAGIKKLAERKPNKLWYCGETLIINERYEDAVELFNERRPVSAFEILCLQLRFREALELAGVGDVRGPYSSWFGKPEPAAEVPPAQRRDRFAMGLSVASMLLRLNEKEDAVDLFEQLARAAGEDKNLSLRSVCEAEYRLGLTQQAFDHAAEVLSRGWNTSVLRTLFPDRQETAARWWKFLCRKYPHEPRSVTLKRIRGLLDPTMPMDAAADDWTRLVAEAEQTSQQLNAGDRAGWLEALGETCRVRGETQLARSCFEKAVQAAPSPSTWIHLGDMAAQRSRWDEAARCYRFAWEHDRTKPTALWLQGRSLVQAGRESEGRKLIEAARLLPLGNVATRCELAEELRRRGLIDEAVRQWRWTLRTGAFQSAPVNQAAERLAEVTAGEDDLKAADYWQWALMRCLRTSTSNLGIEGYLHRIRLIHQTRARGLITAGKIDEAIEEIRLSQAALPGEVELAVEMVPRLQRAGRNDEADRLFAEVFAANERVCGDFPRSTTHRYALARLAAGCGRRLDEAIQHAEKAVALDPQNPAYLGTLAEVRFQRGDRRQAVTLARRCVEMAPQEERFREQLQRFESP